jgi:O-antigen/teichoic acid export membrane protein
MMSSILNMGLGFAFWLIAARLCSPEDVGIAGSLVSILLLIVLLSSMGLDYSLIRNFPESDKRIVFGTSLMVMSLSTLVVSVVFSVILGSLVPDLANLLSPEVFGVFIVCAMASCWVSLVGNVFIASRSASRYFIQSAVMGLRVLILVPLAALGPIGVMGAVGVSYSLALVVSSVFIFRMKMAPSPVFSKSYLGRSFRFSMANYASSLLITGPILLLPTIAINVLGPQDAAFYFVSYSIASLLLVVPNAFSTSLFVEGSHGGELAPLVKKGIRYVTIGMVIPAAFLFVFSDRVLTVFGSAYSENAFGLLRILLISSFLIGGVYGFVSVSRIRKDIGALLFVSGTTSISLLVLSYSFAWIYGLVGLGYAWLASYGLGIACVLIIEFRKRRRGRVSDV